MSDFLPRLLLTHAWQIGAMTLLVLMAARLMGDSRPRLVHALWLLVILKCLTPPLFGHSLGLFSSLQAVFSQAQPSPAALRPPHRLPQTDGPVMSTSGFDERITQLSQGQPALAPDLSPDSERRPSEAVRAARESDFGHTVRSVVLALMAGGAALYCLLLVTRYRRCVRNIRAHRVTDFDQLTQPLLERLCDRLRIRRAPAIVVSDVRWGPAVMGIFRPVIVLPRCLLDSAAVNHPQQEEGHHWLEPIIAHELLHIRRGDLLAGVLQSCAQCLWWFHPGVWLASRSLSRETERCCDAEVITELGCRPSTYARCLLAVIEMKRPLQAVPVFPGMKPVEITSQRMETIMSQTTQTRRRPWQNGIVLALAAILLLPGAAASRPATDDDSAAEPQTSAAAGSASADHGGRLVVLASESALKEHPQQLAALQQTLNEFRKVRLTMRAVQREMSELQALLREAGFLDASVDAKMQDGPLVVRYAVDSGARYRIRRIQGSTPLQLVPVDLPRVSRLFASRYLTSDSLKQVRKSVARDYQVRELPPPNIQITPIFNRQSDQVDLRIEVLHKQIDSPPATGDAATTTVGEISLTSDKSDAERQIGTVHLPDAGTDTRNTRQNARDETVTQQIATAVTSDQGQIGTLQITVTPRIIIQEEEEELIIIPVKPAAEQEAADRKAETVGDRKPATQRPQQATGKNNLSTRIYQVADLLVPAHGRDLGFDSAPTGSRLAAAHALQAQRRYTLQTTTPAARQLPAPNRGKDDRAESNLKGSDTRSTEKAPSGLDRSVDALTALIKASVRPDSWSDDGQLDVNRDSLCLIIRQTDRGHDQVAELLSDLRRDQDVMVVMEATIIDVPAEADEVLQDVEFQQNEQGCDWALLSESRVGQAVKRLRQQGGKILSAPRITTLPGVQAKVEVAAEHNSPALRLATVPRLIGDTGLMRLEYEVGLGQSHPVGGTIKLKSKQTVLLRYENGGPAETADRRRQWHDALSRNVSLHFRNVPLSQVLQDTARVAGTNIALDVAALSQLNVDPDQQVSIQLQDVPLSVALDEVVTQVKGATYEWRGNVLRLTAEPRQPAATTGCRVIAITPRIIRRSELPVQP